MTETVQAVILDWAGTVVDHGSRAPMGAFVQAFAQFGVSISIADARGPMGMAKRDHIRMVGQSPAVAQAWRARHGHDFGEQDIDAIFEVFEPLNVARHPRPCRFSFPAPWRRWRALRGRGIRIGTTTGYTRPIMDELAPIAAAGGYAPEIIVCCGRSAGRPAVVSDDVVCHGADGHLAGPSCGEGGRHAARHRRGPRRRHLDRRSGADRATSPGLSAAELAALPEAERQALRARASAELRDAGADVVIDSIAELPDAIAGDRRAAGAGGAAAGLARYRHAREGGRSAPVATIPRAAPCAPGAVRAWR